MRRRETRDRRQGRVDLRALTDGDLAEIEAWWPEAAATARGQREPASLDDLRELFAGGEAFVIARTEEAAPIGLVAYGEGRDGWLEVTFIALADGQRGWGYGSEAVRLIEESGRGERFTGRVPVGNGLGLYFWLRVGYHPAAAGELPWQEREPDDMISMVRAPRQETRDSRQGRA